MREGAGGWWRGMEHQMTAGSKRWAGDQRGRGERCCCYSNLLLLWCFVCSILPLLPLNRSPRPPLPSPPCPPLCLFSSLQRLSITSNTNLNIKHILLFFMLKLNVGLSGCNSPTERLLSRKQPLPASKKKIFVYVALIFFKDWQRTTVQPLKGLFGLLKWGSVETSRISILPVVDSSVNHLSPDPDDKLITANLRTGRSGFLASLKIFKNNLGLWIRFYIRGFHHRPFHISLPLFLVKHISMIMTEGRALLLVFIYCSQCGSFMCTLCASFPVFGVFLWQRYGATHGPGRVTTTFGDCFFFCVCFRMDEELSSNCFACVQMTKQK